MATAAKQTGEKKPRRRKKPLAAKAAAVSSAAAASSPPAPAAEPSTPATDSQPQSTTEASLQPDAGTSDSQTPGDDQPNKGGRPTKKTPELIAALCKHIGEDCLLTRRAAGAVGIGYRTLLQWQAEDEDFAYLIACAKAARSMKLTGLALMGVPGLSNNAVQLLKWLDQEDAEAKTIKLEGDGEKPVVVEHRAFAGWSAEDLRAFIAKAES